jgi:hypothetical protein
VIADEAEFGAYLVNAWSALLTGGVLFGSTLGLAAGAVMSPDQRGPPRVMPREQLAGHLTGAGFTRPEIEERYHVPHDAADHHDNLCVFQFCTEKPA